MADTLAEIFAAGGKWEANPQLYDYIHSIEFNPPGTPEGTVELTDGGGQVLNTLVRARFAIEQLTTSIALLQFSDAVELNPYYKLERLRGLERAEYIKVWESDIPFDDHDIRSRPNPFSVHVIQEEGVFALRQHVIWKINDEQEWPCLLFRTRCRFAFDPLAAFVSNRQGNLYFEIQGPDDSLPEQVYYQMDDAQRLSLRELAHMGIDAPFVLEEGIK